MDDDGNGRRLSAAASAKAHRIAIINARTNGPWDLFKGDRCM
jgi:hypothetical protein